MLNTISKTAASKPIASRINTYIILAITGFILSPLHLHAEQSSITKHEPHTQHIAKANIAPKVDGLSNDIAWQNKRWHQINQAIIGELPSDEDFSGRYKAVWTEDKLYILAEIVDDILADRHPHPLKSYWNDDTLEILIDENRSGGNHQKNYNAFAYHIALDNQTVDINMSGEPRLLNDHVQSNWKRSTDGSNKVIWEVSISIYPDTFKDHYAENEVHTKPVTLKEGKKMGLMIAYCDNDGGEERESFITSYDIQAVEGDKNRAYIDASVFKTVTLVD